jgi:predicted hydrocarbon binding protein
LKSHDSRQGSHGLDGPNPFFELDRASRRIQDQAFGARAIIINERFWNRLRGELLDLLKDQGPLVLYHMGASYGFEIGSHAYEAEKDAMSATQFLQYYLLMAGRGKVEMAEQKAGRKTMTIRVKDNFFAEAAKSDTGNPSCFFLSGFLAGMAESLFEQDCSCIEDRCMSSGSEACEFVIKQMEP